MVVFQSVRRSVSRHFKSPSSSQKYQYQIQRGMAIDKQLIRGEYEKGPGGRSSIAGINSSIFGGTGFLGKYLCFELGKTGHRVYLANRGDTEDVRQLKVAFDLGMFAHLPYHIQDEDSIKEVTEGTDVCVNMIGKYYETRHAVPVRSSGNKSFVNFTFEEIHIDAPLRLAKIAKEMGVERMIHVSALGADKDSPSDWLRTKALGEEAVKAEFPEVVIVRPGPLFGPEDRLLNSFAMNADRLPFVPLIEGGQSLVQPAYVSDVADAITALVEDTEGEYNGKVFELAGEEDFTWEELMQFTYDVTYQKPRILPVSKEIAFAMGDLLGLLPKPIFTKDEILLNLSDRILEADEKSGILTFKDLEITPTKMEDVAFRYLHRFRAGGHFITYEGYH